MQVMLISKKSIFKTILPKNPLGTYWVCDENKNKLLKIEAKGEEFQVFSDESMQIINPKCLLIDNDNICVNNDIKVIKQITLKEHNMYCMHSENSDEIYILYCMPMYEENYIHLDIKNTTEILIGSGKSNHILYNNALVSNIHAKMLFINGRWMIQNCDKKYGVMVNGKLIRKEILFNGDVIFIMGLKIIIMGKSLIINNPLNAVTYNNKYFSINETKNEEIEEKDEDRDEKIDRKRNSEIYFSRIPRITKKIEHRKVEIVPPPQKVQENKMPWILTFGTTFSMGMFSILHIVTTLESVISGAYRGLQSVVSIIMAILMIFTTLLIPVLSMKWDKKVKKDYEKKRRKIYTQYFEEKKSEINNIINDQKEILIENYAMAEDCTKIILNRSNRLWEKRSDDEDFLEVSLGTGDMPADIDVSYQKAQFAMENDDLIDMLDDFVDKMKIIKNVPVTFSLTKQNMVAIIDKDNNNIKKFIENIIIQLMAFQSYEDLKLVFLLKEDTKSKFEYAKMLPYVWNDSKDFRFFADCYDDMYEVSKYLEEQFKERINNNKVNNGRKRQVPYYLIITNDYRKIENLKIISEVLNSDNNLGFGILCMANDIKELPTECETFIELKSNTGKVVKSESTSDFKKEFKFDKNNMFFFDRIINVISNIKIKFNSIEKAELPEYYTFLDMYNVNSVEQLNIQNRWNNNDSTLSLSAPIGIDTSNRLINLDIHEKFHGPHGLIAGTTGSGKSEFIITYVLSLALNYHPDYVTFVLIDYKGGGLAGAFKKNEVKLPHLVGTITNVDTGNLKRSLASFNSELKRRQILFNEARDKTSGGTIDIYKYQKLYRDGVVDKPIPHLLIICDEFAELKQQQPDFMDELVSVSRIGRSLGVHLILATQKPSGIVDDQMRSNSKFAVCLKVQDTSDSSDLIKRPDAAYIKQSGRFYIQVGNNEYFALGQSGWSGAPYFINNVNKGEEDNSIKFISDIGIIKKEINDYAKTNLKSDGDQLTNIVKYMYDLAKKENIKEDPLWLDNIPDTIYLKDLKNKYKVKPQSSKMNITLGEYDNPYNQKQGIVDINLAKDGNVAIYGRPDSGKETLVSTIIYDIISNYSVEDIWTYVLDFGSEALKIFRNSSHVGEVILANDHEKIGRFFIMLKKEFKERKETLSEYNGDYNFYLKSSGKKMPLILTIINGFENFSEKYIDIYDEFLLTATREGIKYGMKFMAITSNESDLRYRLSQNFPKKIALLLSNDLGYSEIFNTNNFLKPSNIFGRGLVCIDEGVYEFQSAKVCSAEDYNVFITEEIERINAEDSLKVPEIETLPEKLKLEDMKKHITDLSKVPLGLKNKDIQILNYNFKENPINIITSLELEHAQQYINNIIEELKFVKEPGLEIIILDYEKDNRSKQIAIERYEKFKEEFKDKNKFFLCIIIGVDKFINELEDGEEEFSGLVKKVNENGNGSFIIVDNSGKIKDRTYDDWYKNYNTGNNVIWIGNGIDDQYLIEVKMPRKEIMNECGCSFGYLNRNRKTILIKLLEMKEKLEDEDE